MNYYFISNSKDTLGLQKRPLIYKCISNIKASNRSHLFDNYTLKFRRIVRRLISLSRAFKHQDREVRDKIFSLPLFRFYIICIIFQIYSFFLSYYMLVRNGHYNKEKNDFWSMYECFFDFDDYLFRSKPGSCFNLRFFLLNKFIFASQLFWMFIIVLQLRFGLPLWRSLITSFNIFDKVTFLSFNNAPFLKEIYIFTKFASTKSSLLLYDWFTIADTYFIMKKTKFKQLSKEKYPFTYKLGLKLKFLIGVLVIIVTLIFFIGPLVPFSTSIGFESQQEIIGSSIDISLISRENHIIGVLFSSQMMISSTQAEISKPDSYCKFLRNIRYIDPRRFNFVNNKLFKNIKMSSYSQTLHDLNLRDDFQYNGDEKFFNMINGGSLEIKISFMVSILHFYGVIDANPIRLAQVHILRLRKLKYQTQMLLRSPKQSIRTAKVLNSIGNSSLLMSHTATFLKTTPLSPRS